MEDKNVKNIENNEQVVEETTISVEPKKEGLFAKGKEFYNKNKGKVKAVAFTGLKNEVVDETVIDEETGKKKKVKTTVSTFDPNEISQFAVVFDSGCKGWTPDPALNKAFLLQTQNYLNDKLKHDKRLFLNDVYEELGFAKTQAGQIVGWLYDEKCPNGDNCIDFNIWDISNEATRRFLNGLETNILLDFNVDGPIIDKAW